mmetsp:Transcript_65684/g.174028  ORF Transcript_65684/g.174028 Transcript_65684/m.174028 type:complete len:297 (-) Transcript_65684:249-1139(-)|eukprot:CAMPEP_0194539756 /NCGR_PEP_ID=MMETSP0253-20130528/79786_1 /TAXON_ID=2966 /ORGANISM="Noctiluca scintillans" /LENGTH=296 /DNA_ID=CAMNT_0039386061 /DNA_START=119 /DNA_END=1009 /DNA_ORIENTATION=+
MALSWTTFVVSVFLHSGVSQANSIVETSRSPSSDDPRRDDDAINLRRLRDRIAAFPFHSDVAVVLTAGPADLAHSDLTVPIWEAYCRHHGFDFFLHQRVLSSNVSLRFEWTKPRLLMELLPTTTWKYLWLVDAHSLPVRFHRGFKYAIQSHMRKKRHSRDDVRQRLIWCPLDCEEEYLEHNAHGACYGPHLSGCILRVSSQTARLAAEWYAKRVWHGASQEGLRRSLVELRQRHYGQIFFSDVGAEMGRSTSSFLALFVFDPSLGFDTRRMIERVLQGDRVLSRILEDASQFKAEF